VFSVFAVFCFVEFCYSVNSSVVTLLTFRQHLEAVFLVSFDYYLGDIKDFSQQC